MKKSGLLGLFAVMSVFAVGCEAGTEDDATGAEEGALHSATDCPKSIEVQIGKPFVMSDAKLLAAYTRDFKKWDGNDESAKKDAQYQLDAAKGMIAMARADKAVKLRGELQQACAYKTFDAETGAQVDYSLWLSSDGKELRVSQGIAEPDHQLYTSVPVKKLSKTELTLDSSKDSSLSAEDTSNGHDGSDGWTAWIGYVKITGSASK